MRDERPTLYMRMEVAAARVMKFEERRERLRPAG